MFIKLLLILLLQLVYVPMLTLRTIAMVKNLKLMAVIFGFLESSIYVFGLGMVLTGSQNYIEMLVYAMGYAAGLYLGICIEQKLSIGYITVNINILECDIDLISRLREKGFGVSSYVGEGRNGKRVILDVLSTRKREKELYELVNSVVPNAFMVSYEPKTFKGGFLSKFAREV
ncbi:MAG: DUF2179 domain-containing protein [Lachnospirales bacterium]